LVDLTDAKEGAVMTCVDVSDLGHCPLRKPVFFHPAAHAEIQAMSRTVRKQFGGLLGEMQKGHALRMPHSRPMSIVALGVEELRVKDESGQYRAFVVRKTPRGIAVLHIFNKKSRKTPRGAIELARRRLKEI
jgi:phage-related protein